MRFWQRARVMAVMTVTVGSAAVLLGCGALDTQGGACDPPVPLITRVDPTSLRQFSPPALLTIAGRDFQPTAYAVWDGQLMATTYFSQTMVVASVSIAKLQESGTHQLQVFNPPPQENGQSQCAAARGRASNAVAFNVTPP